MANAGLCRAALDVNAPDVQADTRKIFAGAGTMSGSTKESKMEQLPRIRTDGSQAIPVVVGTSLFGFCPLSNPPDQTQSIRAERLLSALVEDSVFDPLSHEYRIGTLPDGRLAILGVIELKYVYAWEATAQDRVSAHAMRKLKSNIRVVNPIPPFSPEFLLEMAREAFKGVSAKEHRERARQYRAEVERRRKEFHEDIIRYGSLPTMP